MVVDTSLILVVIASLTAKGFAEPEFTNHINSSVVEKTVHKKDSFLVDCQPPGNHLLSCLSSNKCIHKTKICDGIKDCSDGEDETPAMCAKWKCPDDSIRCENNNVCLPPAHTSLCSGKSVCPDRSDQSYCSKKEFTGCMAMSKLGMKIMDCGSCFCDLRNKSATIPNKSGEEEKQSLGMLFSSSLPQSKVYIVARICMERTQSNLFCDGVEDCVDGEDEDGELCYTNEDRLGRVQTNNVDLEEDNDGEDDNVKKDTIEETGDFNFHGDYIDMTIIVIIFFISCVTVVGICFIIIFVIYKVIKTKKKQGLQQLLSPSLNHHGSNPSFHDILPQLAKTSPPLPQKPSWSLRTANIVKELGHGFYSKVYLAQDAKGSFVALKTVDSQKTTNAEECISNEIDILSTIGSHLNIVKLLGFNREEKLIVMEYCFNGNLKDYITRYRDYYLDEINPSTGELREETLIHNSSPTDSETFPMSDFLSSMHADVDNEESLKRRNKDVCSMAGNKSLIKTRRLLYWSYQISRGMKHLGDLGIIHRDIALRNMLLTNNDVVKIADFGLAVNIFSRTGAMTSGSAMPQYWSQNNKPQPYKWMAPESLIANVFSQSSDVWSYGVTLWEMFTLGSEPHGNMSPMELTQALQTGHRLDHCRRAPLNISRMMTHCWHSDPAMRPGFDTIVMGLASYMSRNDRTSYDARSTASMGMVDSGYGVSTPSTGTASKSSTRSRTVSKCSELSWLPSSSSSQVPSPKIARASYWANYKGMNSSESQVYSSIDNYPTRYQHNASQATRNADRQFNTLDTYLRGRNNHY